MTDPEGPQFLKGTARTSKSHRGIESSGWELDASRGGSLADLQQLSLNVIVPSRSPVTFDNVWSSIVRSDDTQPCTPCPTLLPQALPCLQEQGTPG